MNETIIKVNRINNKSLLQTYKQLVYLSLCYDRIKRNPKRFYNHCIELLYILGFATVKQGNITFETAINEVYYLINLFENEILI